MNTSVRHGGIYVKAVIPKGAAELDGRIQKGRVAFIMTRHCCLRASLTAWPPVLLSGDRVVAVNSKSLEGATHQQAVEVLKDTGQVSDDVLHR